MSLSLFLNSAWSVNGKDKWGSGFDLAFCECVSFLNEPFFGAFGKQWSPPNWKTNKTKTLETPTPPNKQTKKPLSPPKKLESPLSLDFCMPISKDFTGRLNFFELPGSNMSQKNWHQPRAPQCYASCSLMWCHLTTPSLGSNQLFSL